MINMFKVAICDLKEKNMLKLIFIVQTWGHKLWPQDEKVIPKA